MAEQTIAKLLVVVKNHMQSKLENRKELQSLRKSMQHAKAEKLELPLTAKFQHFVIRISVEEDMYFSNYRLTFKKSKVCYLTPLL
jgi:hypothetical protein